ncbi:hypothetical protein N7G274_005951 [Stereocaulon virgatum]|uniref:DUF202 domain-containing protein n=1 Tax=Stereocaulon virgatum TaxID=373712 RepID=A0ABR4AA04_9LECA
MEHPPSETPPEQPEEDSEREATELADFRGHPSRSSDSIIPSQGAASASIRSNEGYLQSLRRSTLVFWKRQVSATVPHEACRDHFALERTFLGYLRTSIGLSVVAVIISQLFRLSHNATPNKAFGFFVLGTPIACSCIGAAVVVLLLGAYRFWRQQNAMLRGKVHAGGWEVNAIGMMVFMIVLTLFVLVLAVDIYKDVKGEP